MSLLATSQVVTIYASPGTVTEMEMCKMLHIFVVVFYTKCTFAPGKNMFVKRRYYLWDSKTCIKLKFCYIFCIFFWKAWRRYIYRLLKITKLKLKFCAKSESPFPPLKHFQHFNQKLEGLSRNVSNCRFLPEKVKNIFCVSCSSRFCSRTTTMWTHNLIIFNF